jgi:ribosomal-protein-alanine N-acetyltransferase
LIVTQTARLTLRHVAPGDEPHVLALLTDADFLANIGDRGVHSIADAEQWVRIKMPAAYAEHGFGMFAVVERATGVWVGIAGLVRREGLDHVDVGYALLPDARGKGYALEAARGVLDWATEQGHAPVVAIVSPGNARSISVLEALGMVASELRRMPGAEHDVMLYVPAALKRVETRA